MAVKAAHMHSYFMASVTDVRCVVEVHKKTKRIIPIMFFFFLP